MKALLVCLLVVILAIPAAGDYLISEQELTILETTLREAKNESIRLSKDLEAAKNSLTLVSNELKQSKSESQALKTSLDEFEKEVQAEFQKTLSKRDAWRGVALVGIPVAALITGLVVGLSK